MGFFSDMEQKYGLVERTVVSRKKTVDEQICETIENQIKIADGEKVKGTNGKELTSWRDADKRSVKISSGVLPLFIKDKVAAVFKNVDVKSYKEMLVRLKRDYEAGGLAAEVADLKVRKADLDKKAANTRKEKKAEKAVVNEDRSSLG